MRSIALATVFVSAALGVATAGERDKLVNGDKEAIAGAGTWIYNDLPKAFAQAKQSKKPLLVVHRCIP